MRGPRRATRPRRTQPPSVRWPRRSSTSPTSSADDPQKPSTSVKGGPFLRRRQTAGPTSWVASVRSSTRKSSRTKRNSSRTKRKAKTGGRRRPGSLNSRKRPRPRASGTCSFCSRRHRKIDQGRGSTSSRPTSTAGAACRRSPSTRRSARPWAGPWWRRRSLTATRRTRGTWKSSPSSGRTPRKRGGSGRCSTARSEAASA
mmetsp:Transcript_10348/g.34178  ORF Transcript_10348/g.34178 Transcript_10348/m.34178 type:complete len:201 (+) Transcript_10348:1154-1756(+)